MTQHDKAPELVERLKVVARCGTDSTMRHFAYASMAQDPDGDYVTYCAYAALSDENRRLREALEDIADAASAGTADLPRRAYQRRAGVMDRGPFVVLLALIVGGSITTGFLLGLLVGWALF